VFNRVEKSKLDKKSVTYPWTFRDSLVNFSTENTSSYQIEMKQYFSAAFACITVILHRWTSTYELSRNEQFVFMNIVWTNKLQLPTHLTNTGPCAYEHCNKLTIESYKKVELANIELTNTFQRTHYVHWLGFTYNKSNRMLIFILLSLNIVCSVKYVMPHYFILNATV
jgi:hypothetical protein